MTGVTKFYNYQLFSHTIQLMEYIMKKLMVAAVAATMASASMADISIKGDAYIQYVDRGIGGSGSDTENHKRVNLNVIGKSGATTVVANFNSNTNMRCTRNRNCSTAAILSSTISCMHA
jgi:hypothetical protein